jgi:large subunit ribosomal protein L30
VHREQTDKPKMRVTLKRSLIGCRPSHRACVKGLGLRRLGQTVEVEDTAATRGMARRVHYLVEVQ